MTKEKEHGAKLKKYRKNRKWLWGLGALVAVFAIGAGWFGLSAANAISKITDSNNDRSSPLLRWFGQDVTPDQLKGEGDGRINILLIGIGGAGHQGGALADTIMVASIDSQNNQVGLLSIPRDLLVKIPGYNEGKINSAHSYGEQQEEGGGPRLLKEVVSEVIDLPIHYYFRVDFDGFEEFIDALGGVEIDVSKALNDPFYPDDRLVGYQPLYIPAGLQLMDGDTALRYARSRKTTSDFDRASRQQQIILGVRDKAISAGVIANPIKLNEIIQIVGDHLKTDIALDEIKSLLTIAQKIDSDSVITKVLDNSTNGVLKTYSNGGYYLIPKAGMYDYSEIQKMAHELFKDPYLARENAKIEILNGSSTAGQALKLSEDLQALGYNIVSIDKAESTKQTVIYDYSSSTPFTASFLANRVGVSITPGQTTEADGVDIRIILGDDYQNSSS
ncbi:LCP family protein [Candidatus Berkelbacteria bacterium]|nr:LCP family protein [Candidatus Berkelbacteria bacterium]